MKAILEFDLGEPSDILSHKRCVKAADAYYALHQIAYKVFRNERKYTDHSEEVVEMIEKLESRFYAVLDEQGIDLNDLD